MYSHCERNGSDILKHAPVTTPAAKVVHSTLPITKKYVKILPHYRWLFIKGDVFIGEWVYLVQRFSFVIADFSFKATSL